MKVFSVKPPKDGVVKGNVTLNGSKSIANRALIIRALCKESFEIANLSNADDTAVLDRLLQSDSAVLDAGAGGTTYRFLCAYLSTQEGREVVLTGSERMQQRPIKLLVEALQQLGADIEYVNASGFPPLRIKGKKLEGGKISIPADTSSQYISALLMVGPTLAQGLELHLVGEIVSLPYILMTINLMRYFGVEAEINDNVIVVKSGEYKARPFFVEADWSAASYFYAITFLAKEAEITLSGLNSDSVQGDAVIADIFSPWVNSEFQANTVQLSKAESAGLLPEVIYYDFIQCPDLAQTVVAALAIKGISGEFNGLKTLLIKETDRVEALNKELSPYGIQFVSTGQDLWSLSASNVNIAPKNIPSIQTYEDHRMAMAFAPLALETGEMHIAEPWVVTKSYPAFWDDLRSLGFDVKELD